MLLMIDNYDSFVYNLVQYFGELGCDVLVKRNDAISIAEIRELNPKWIVISPGPGTPNEAEISLQIVKELSDEYPILGVCLGHQCIAQVFGGEIIHANKIMHGKVSLINHNKKGLFKNIPSPMQVTRYHSLVADEKTLPSCLQETAFIEAADDKEKAIMAIEHKTKPIYGVQFHPESIMTDNGLQLLKNFLEISSS